MSITVDEALDRLRGDLTSIDEEALDVVFEHWEEALPVLLREIESAEVVSRGDELYDISLFHAAIVLCAEKRESRAFAAIQKRVVTLQYDSLPFGFQRFRLSAAWAACCDSADQLLAVFDDEVLYPKAREEAFHALLFLREERRWSDGEFTSWLSGLIESRLTTLPPELASAIILVASGMLPEVPKVLTDRLVEYANQVDSDLSKSLESMLAPEQGNFFKGVIDTRYRKVDSAADELDFLIDVNAPEDEIEELLAVMDDPDYLLEILDGKREMELVDLTGVGRNDSCPCGSGKKFKKCCQGKDVTLAPVDRISCQGTPVRREDQLISDLIEAGYIYDEDEEDLVLQMACWLLAAIMLAERVPKSITSPSAVEKKQIFVGSNRLTEWIEDFCRMIFLMFKENSPVAALAHRELGWMIAQFTGAGPVTLSRIHTAYGLMQYLHCGPAEAVCEFRKAIQLNPEEPLARCLCANFLRSLGESGIAEAKQILREGIALKPHESMQKVLESLEN